MHAPGKYPRDADTWTRSGRGWSEYFHPGVTHSREGSVPITHFFDIGWQWAGSGRTRGTFCGTWQVLRVAPRCGWLAARCARDRWAGAASAAAGAGSRAAVCLLASA
eukprot:4022587-Prymnesium_polylepis.1